MFINVCLRKKNFLLFLYQIQNSYLDWLDLKVKSNQRKDKTLEILNKIIETTETIRILAAIYVYE